MKKIFKNKKGFTLVELLAVIVVLAIIMVIATQQIGKVIAGARADSFVESYQMIAKQVNTYIASDQPSDQITCDDTDSDTTNNCSSKYGLSSDYSLTVTNDTGSYTITLEAATSGKFANMNLTENGKTKCILNDTTDSQNNTIKDTKGKITINSTKVDCEAKKISGTVNIP